MTVSDDPLGWLGCTIDGRFAIDELVGEGGFGVVYRARHLSLQVPVGVKCLKVPSTLNRAARDAFLSTFRAEAKLLHKLSRKTAGIVQALDFGSAESRSGHWTPYLVMEWLDGQSLEDELIRRTERRERARTLDEALALLNPVIESLALAHAEGVAHLDVKPANIFLCADGATKLLDFGIAKVFTESDALTRALTATGQLSAFTPGYAAPEQFNRRHGQPGPQCDVFALGLILIELCSGDQALQGDTPLQLYIAAANESYRPSLAAHGVEVTQAVADVVRRALEVAPQKRLVNAGALRAALDEATKSWSPIAQRVAEPVLSIVPASRHGGDVTSATARTMHGHVPLSTGQNRVCTILVTELTGTAEAAELLDPEQLGELVDRLLKAVAEQVSSLGGVVERQPTDTLLAVFGLYGDSASAAQRAVHAALQLAGALDSVALPPAIRQRLALGVRAGIATGRVFVSAQQTSTDFKLMPTGAPIKLAAQLQQSAEHGAILVDRDTYREIAGLFEVDHLETTGSGSRPLKTYRVNGLSRNRHALHATALREFYGYQTRFVGRAAEMAALASCADTAMNDPRARFATVLGAPGVGKSRLLVELADRLESEDWLVFAAHCSPLHTQNSYGLVAALLRARFHICEDDSSEVASSKLERGLRTMRGITTVDAKAGLYGITGGRLSALIDSDEIVAPLLRLLGVEVDDQVPLSADAETSAAKTRIAAAMANMLQVASRPVALLCDDLHRADEASLGLLAELCLRLADTPLLIVATARPELIERRPLWGEGDETHIRVSMAPLARRQLHELARDRLRQLPDDATDVIHTLAEHAGGNPLALVETLHLLVDLGAIDPAASGRWEIKRELLSDLALPTTVHGIVQARLDRLDEPARRLLGHAAVVGLHFWDGALLALEQTDDGFTLHERLAELRERGFIYARASSTFPDEHEYVFVETTTQRAAYEMLPRQERRQKHLLVAAWLKDRTTEQANDALLASHYERGGAAREAFAAYQRAGARAAGLGEYGDARHSFERACVIDDWMSGVGDLSQSSAFLVMDTSEDSRFASWPSRVALRVDLGDVLRRAGHFDAAEERYRQARERIVRDERRADEALDAREVPRWDARVDYRCADLAKLRGDIAGAGELLERAIEHARQGGLEEEWAEMWALLASLRRREGALESCKGACIQGLRVCRAISPRGERARYAASKLLNALGGMFFSRRELIRAERCHLQAARLIDPRRDPDQQSRALNNVAAVRFSRGDLEGARASFRAVLRLVERSGDLWMKVTALSNLGEVELELGGALLARECLEEATRLGERLGAELDLAESYRHLARAQLATGMPREALASARRALTLVQSGSGKTYLGGVLRSAAEIAVAVAERAGEDAPSAKALVAEVRQVVEEAGDALVAADREAVRTLLAEA